MKLRFKRYEQFYVTILLLIGVIVFLTIKYIQIKQELSEVSEEIETREEAQAFGS